MNPIIFGRSYQDGYSYYNLGEDQWFHNFYVYSNPDLTAGVVNIDNASLDTHIYNQQKAAKERLLQINEDIIARKLSTLNRYYTKQIEKARYSLQQAKNERIRTMYHARIQKLELAWKEKEDALNGRLKSDILVKHFASGTIEVI